MSAPIGELPLRARCFGWLVFVIMLAGFVIAGWCSIFARYLARLVRLEKGKH